MYGFGFSEAHLFLCSNALGSKCKVFINETEIIGPVACFMSCSVFTVGLRCQGIPKKSIDICQWV